jgi:hypothetical protein
MVVVARRQEPKALFQLGNEGAQSLQVERVLTWVKGARSNKRQQPHAQPNFRLRANPPIEILPPNPSCTSLGCNSPIASANFACDTQPHTFPSSVLDKMIIDLGLQTAECLGFVLHGAYGIFAHFRRSEPHSLSMSCFSISPPVFPLLLPSQINTYTISRRNRTHAQSACLVSSRRVVRSSAPRIRHSD